MNSNYLWTDLDFLDASRYLMLTPASFSRTGSLRYSLHIHQSEITSKNLSESTRAYHIECQDHESCPLERLPAIL